MKIRVSDIGAAGLKVNDTIPLEPLNSRMNEACHNDILFTENPDVEVMVHRTPSGAQVKGFAKAKYTQPCSLCLEDLERQAEVKIDYVFQRKNPLELSAKNEKDYSYYDDIGICYFSGEHIELEELIQESLILSLDQYWRPPQTEKGSCSICGADCSKMLAIGE